LKAVEVTDQDFIDMWPEVTENYEHPFEYHPNSIPFLKVTKLVRSNGVKAVLSGEGADECFLGYTWCIFDIRGFVRELIKRPNPPDADAALIRGLCSRFEVEDEMEEIREHVCRVMNRKVPDRDMATLFLLCSHLRTILHRNDCLGMAASIEARFPFLDRGPVSLAVNMPRSCKVRFSPVALDRAHYFLQDKWALRQVARRYLPPFFMKRKKFGFFTCTQLRMAIRPELYDDSFVVHLFGLSKREFKYFYAKATHQQRLRLLHLEVWGSVCLHSEPTSGILEKMRKSIRITKNWNPSVT